jgi:hypothetical protein
MAMNVQGRQMWQLPVTEDRVVALPTSSTLVAETLSSLKAGLQQAVGQMGADDVILEIDANAARLHVRFRAYKHRR